MSNLRKLREERGLRQDELADLAGTSQAQISRLEKSSGTLKKKLATRLGEIFGIHPAWIMFDPAELGGLTIRDGGRYNPINRPWQIIAAELVARATADSIPAEDVFAFLEAHMPLSDKQRIRILARQSEERHRVAETALERRLEHSRKNQSVNSKDTAK